MKKLICVIMALCMTGALAACGTSGAGSSPNEPSTSAEVSGKEVKIEYGSSDIYSQKDIDEAIDVIQKEFSTWKGCELHSIRYDTDECNSKKNIKWMNSLKKGQNYTECIKFLADFHSPVEGYGAWEPDTEYADYQWWLARSEGGNWELLTWGFG